MSDITRKIFEEPSPAMLGLFKTYTYKLGSKEAPFGFQYMPGGGSFEGYADIGADMGASFDGRKKGQAIGEDNSPQNYPLDIPIDDPRYQFKPQYFEDILKNYTHVPQTNNLTAE